MNGFYKTIFKLTGIVILFLITSCANKKIITIDKDIRRIEIIDHKGYLIKTYYEKYNNEYPGWLKANCNKVITSQNEILSSIKCNFTSASLNLINNSKNDNKTDYSMNILNNNDQQEESQEEESQEEESQQEESQQEDSQEEENNEDPPFREECNNPKIC